MRRTLTTGFSICAMLALSLSTLTHAAAGGRRLVRRRGDERQP